MGLKELIQSATALFTGILIPIAFALCLLYFFWGVAKYIKSAGTDKEEGKSIMVWGVVGLFVAASIWGIIFFIRREFQISDKAEINIELNN